MFDAILFLAGVAFRIWFGVVLVVFYARYAVETDPAEVV